MDNFLTMLYYERFQLSEKQRKLMHNTTFESSVDGRIECARNDQSITEVTLQLQMIDRLIVSYIEKIKSE